MTREEAKEFAEKLKNNYTINFNDIPAFCDVVMEALEQEPCDDAISRQGFLKNLDGWKNMNRYYHPYSNNKKILFSEVIDIVERMPSVVSTKKKQELDDICKEIKNLMTCEISETLERYCKVTVDYIVTLDVFHCVAETEFYGGTISSYCTIPAKEILNKTQDELRETCNDYAGAMFTALKDFMRRYGNKKEGEK